MHIWADVYLPFEQSYCRGGTVEWNMNFQSSNKCHIAWYQSTIFALYYDYCVLYISIGQFSK